MSTVRTTTTSTTASTATTTTASARSTAFVAATVESPVGVLTLVADDDALVAVLWPDDDVRRVPAAAGATRVDATAHPVLAAAAAQLEEYFAGRRIEFDLPLRPAGTPFQLATWDVLRAIPYGRTMTYGEQAAELGDPTTARAVGAANGRNPLSIVVPCHRVTGSGGSLTGFAGGLDAKRWLLEHEQRVLAASA